MSEMVFPLINDTTRKIIHIDMDAFFAAVEERNNPALVGKPVVIARHPKETGGRGVVSTANYIARQFGIHSAMSSAEAYRLCPKAIFISGNYEKYREISVQIRKIFLRYTDVIEPISIDEAYLDVTNNKKGIKSAIKIAKLIQHEIWKEIELTCSAGVSYNKFLAKLASDFQKPKGLTVVMPEEAVSFLSKLPIEKFYGVGKKTLSKMYDMGIYTGEDLYQQSEMFLIRQFGKMGYSLYRKVRGIHLSPVDSHWERKSYGKETTYVKELFTDEEVLFELKSLAQRVEKGLLKAEKQGKTIVLKVRYSDFTTHTKRVTLFEDVSEKEDLYQEAAMLWEEIGEARKGIRLLGITVTNLISKRYTPIRLDLWKGKNLGVCP